VNHNVKDRVNDFPLEQVPAHNRCSWFRLSIVWVGFVLCMTNFLTGSSIAYGLHLRDSILAIFLGNAILTLIAIGQGLLAQKSGYSFSFLSQFTFGTLGAKLVAVVIAISFIGWAAVGIGLGAETVGLMIHINPRYIALIFTLVFSVSALFGIYGLSRVSAFGIPIILFISFFGLFRILASKGLSFGYLFEIPPYKTIGFGEAVSITVGSWIVGAIASPDILRYARRKRDIVVSMIITFLLLNTIQMSIGSAMGLVTGTWNLPIILNRLGFGFLGVLLLIFVSWTTADNDMYAAGLGLSTLLKSRNRLLPTIICIAVGGVLSIVGFYRYFSTYLHSLSIIFTPFGSIMLLDFLFFSSGRSYGSKADIRISWRAGISLLIGVAAGFILDFGAGFIISMVSAGLSYVLLNVLLPRQQQV